MGLINSCWDTILKFAAIVHFVDYDFTQQPLPLQDTGVRPDHLQTVGVSFSPQNATRADFQCHYPRLHAGWRGCNSAEDRSCWLKNTKTNDVYDIHTNCEFIGCKCYLL